MALPTLLKFSEPGVTTAGQLYPTQAGAPRFRPSRAGMLAHTPPLPSPPRSRDSSRPRYSRSSSESFSDEFYHPPRRTARWGAFSWPVGLYKASVSRFGRRRGPILLCFCCVVLLFTTYAVLRRFLCAEKSWPRPFERPPPPVFGKEDVRRIWEWEIRAGHYPSRRPISAEVGFTVPPRNPALPHDVPPAVAGNGVQHTVGTGVQRIYPEVRHKPREFGHPPRPIPGSIADLDRILEHCDYDTGKYIRDCHEYLRLGAGLDNAARLRREHVEDLRYIYVPDAGAQSAPRSQLITHANSNLTIKDSNDWHLTLSTPNHHGRDISSPCHEDDPRIFHMFWAGEFTDKPYMAILAFLFTQNLGLHLDSAPSESDNCRPQLWLWLSHVSTDATSNPAAQDDLIAELRQNPWASPFLHPRFRDLVQFRLWNTTEQLDSITELKDDWRALGQDLLRSEGKSPPKGTTGIPISLDGTGKVTHQSYNKVPVVLSDLARFVLCHRFGGVYLDVDMLFLRDWEELWGWSGSFSYRWSHEHRYNTAVLRLRRGSALGTFLIRTALANGLDFHPTTVTRYLKDAHMTELLYRVPDALFDPGWQTCDYIKGWFGTTYLQRDRPPQPYFTDFDQFFNTPDVMSGMPSVIGFDGFFRGAFLYHYHNEWWKPFDRARYWPDLGPRFAEAERMGRAAIANQNAAFVSGLLPRDKRDLDWATVMKRTFEAYMRGERPNMYGEWIQW